jgi:branched-chain amino acid transport system permease protein
VASLASGVIAVVVERLCYKPLRGAGRIVALLAALGVSMFLQNFMQQGATPDYRKFPPTLEVQRYPKFELQLDALDSESTAERDTALSYYARDERGRLQLRQYMLAEKGEAFDARKLREARMLADNSAAVAKVYGYPAVTLSSKQLALFITLGLVALLLFWIVQHTRFGRAMRAVSHDFEAARLMGINVDRVITGTFFIGAFVAGMGGVLTGGMYFERIDPLMGTVMGLKAFIAAVLGGIGSIPGAILGALLLGVSEKLVEASPYSGARDGVAFAILIGVLLVRPQGLLGRFEGEKV